VKSKLAPRHIIPVVCYAVLFLAFILIAVLGFGTHFTSSESLEGTGMIGLLVIGIAAAVKFVLILIGIGGALMALFPLTFSSINIAKRERKLAIACLVFDANFVFFFVFLTLFSIFSANTPTLPLTYVVILALCTLSLVMNILNVKKNKPVEAAAEIAVEQDDLTA